MVNVTDSIILARIPPADLGSGAKVQSLATLLWGLTPVSARLRLVSRAVARVVVGGAVARVRITAAAVAAAAAVLFLVLQQRIDVHELGLLQELAAGDVRLLLLLRQESDVQTLDVLLHVELVLAHRTALRALDGGIERAEALNLHALRLQQHLNQAAAELLHHAVNHVGRVDRTVLGNVVRQPTGVQTLQILHASVELAEGAAVLVLVLVHFINNLRHTS